MEEEWLPPKWQGDKERATCNNCERTWTLTRRRHHCRVCGLLFCGTCSGYETSIPGQGNKIFRSCEKCKTKYGGRAIHPAPVSTGSYQPVVYNDNNASVNFNASVNTGSYQPVVYNDNASANFNIDISSDNGNFSINANFNTSDVPIIQEIPVVLNNIEVKISFDVELQQYCQRTVREGGMLETGLDDFLLYLEIYQNTRLSGSYQDDYRLYQDCLRDKKLLADWLESFKLQFQYQLDKHDCFLIVSKCNSAIYNCDKWIQVTEIPLAIEQACEGLSVLEYGLAYHLNKMRNISVLPIDLQNLLNWILDRENECSLLVKFLNDFKMKFGNYEEARSIIFDCEQLISYHNGQVIFAQDSSKILAARKDKNSILEYGLDYHTERMRNALEKGIPNDPRFPERDNEWMVEREKEYQLLIKWLDSFKMNFSNMLQRPDANAIIIECDNLCQLYFMKTESVKTLLLIQNARNAKRAEGSILEYGFKYHLENMIKALEKGIPNDPRFPERDNEWIAAREKEYNLLVQWFDDFKAKYIQFAEAAITVNECQNAFSLYNVKVGGARIPLLIQNARNAKRAEGSILEYGFKYHTENMTKALEKGIPNDPRFPERDNEWIAAREKEYNLLVEWFEDFKSKYQQYNEAAATLVECQTAFSLYNVKVSVARIPLLIQNARNAKRAEGSTLEYGLKYHLENMIKALEKGIPNDPRFPERDNEWIAAREKEYNLLFQWLDDFKSKYQQYAEAAATISECESAFSLFNIKVGAARIPLLIQNARNAKRAEGSTLEFGLKYHLEHMNSDLEKGVPNDPRFPERDNEWITAREKEYNLLFQWLEDFKSKYQQYPEAAATISECESAFSLFNIKVGAARIPLLIQNARNARTEQGSVLEYGLQHHLEGMTKALEKGIPNEPRFPERDNEWVTEREKENNLLIQWLEDFKSRYQQYAEAAATISECESALSLFNIKLGAVRIPLLIQNARLARTADGSVLEYGLQHHLEGMTKALEKGIPNDPRFPERDNEWIVAREKEYNLLVEWFEDFKSKYEQYAEAAAATIVECQTAFSLYNVKVSAARIPLLIQNGRLARREQGSVLEYGLQHHLEGMTKALEKGIPNDESKTNQWMAEREKENSLLVEWLEDFKSKYEQYAEAAPTIFEAQSAIQLYKDKALSAGNSIKVQNARNARRADGSILEYGLKYHLENMIKALEKGIPNDPRFPERDNEWIVAREKEYNLLVEWFEDFKSKYIQYTEAADTVTECESAFSLYKLKVDSVKIPLLIQNARNARRAEGSVLEYGLKYHLDGFTGALNKGIPTDESKTNQWLAEREKEYNLIVEWLEDFKSKHEQYPEAAPTISECESSFTLYKDKALSSGNSIKVQNARNARRADGSVLEYGLKYHLENMVKALEKGIPNDPRFPERDNEWIVAREKEYNLLVEWFEDFKSKFEHLAEAAATITEVESAFSLYKLKVDSVKIPLLIQNARNARRADGSVLEYGLKYHLENMIKALEKGIPNDPRFPERDNEWITAREKENNLLVEWFEDFKSKYILFQQYNEAAATIDEVQSAFSLYKLKVDSVKIPLLIQNARNAKRAEKSVLEYGLKHHLENMIKALEKGIPNDPRFPERDNEWIVAREKENNLLVEWFEDFKSKFQQYNEAAATIDEVQSAFSLYKLKVDSVKIPLLIQNARNAKRAEGSILEYGLKYHLENMTKALEKGIPNDPRFPERDNEWIVAREKEQNLLVEWLEDFKSKFQQYPEAAATISECESAFSLYKLKVDSVKIPLLIQNARNAKRAEGSVLEYGLKYHLEHMNKDLEKGIPNDPRFPERDNEWLTAREKEYNLLVQWLEDFKSKFQQYPEADATVDECESAFSLYKLKVDAVKIPLLIQNARNAKRAEGSILEYGLKYHLEHMNKDLEKGIPNDPRFPERDNEWIAAREKEYNLLVEWLEDFKSKFEQYNEAAATIDECESAFTLYTLKVGSIKIPLLIQNARLARTQQGSVLEYGLQHHLEGMTKALEKGIPNDPRFPERDNEWIEAREKENNLLVEWLEDFKSKYIQYPEAAVTLDEVESAFSLYKRKAESVRIPLLIQNARLARTQQGSVLEYGLKYHLEHMIPALEKGIPNDPRFPERDNEWIAAREKENNLLVEWFEDFKSKYEQYSEAAETIAEVESALSLYKIKVDDVKIPLLIQNARNAKRAEGSILEYGLKYHLEGMTKALEKGIPNDDEWIVAREKENNLLIEFFEDFKSKYGQYSQADETINEIESALSLYSTKVESIRIPLLIQNARNAKRAEGSILEYGLKYHLEGMTKALEKGIPNDPRFPERDNEWIAAREKEYNLLIEWLEDFKSKYGQYSQADETILEVENTIALYITKVETVKIPLLIQNARNAKRAEGSILEYGLQHHLEGMTKALEKGIPNDPRFPERDNEWIVAREKENNLLVEWLEDFKAKYEQYDLAMPTITECENAFMLYKLKVETVKIPLLIQNARNAKRAEGSILEYGLKYHLEGMNKALEKGIPNDPRFPERDNEWLAEREKEYNLLLEWFEDFKSKYFKTKYEQYSQSQETISEVEAVLELCKTKVNSVKIPLLIQNARLARSADGSVLEYGLKYHLEHMNSALEKGIPNDPRFPERDNEWITAREKEHNLLVQWFEDFKSKYIQYPESNETAGEVESALSLYKQKAESVRIPLLIQNARLARREQGNVLEFGLKYHLEHMNSALEKGIPNDPRFPERDNEWLAAREKEYNLLVEWLEDFKSKYQQYSQAEETIYEVEAAFALYRLKVEPVRIPLLIQNAKLARTADGSVLEFGLKYHLEHMNSALEKGIPNDPRFPERDNEWITAREKEYNLLVEWLEDFKSKFSNYAEHIQEVLSECTSAINLYYIKAETVRIPLLIQNARLARTADGSVLEFGLKYHLEHMIPALEKGIPNDPRFPERDNEWMVAREKEYNLLVEWLEDFKSKYGSYSESNETINECQSAMDLYFVKIGAIRVPLLIQNARLARTADGSVLEFGLKYHLEHMIPALEKGIPNDPRFPERDNEWVAAREKEYNLLVEWLEDFKSKCEQYAEAAATITECESAIALYKIKVDAIKIPLLIQNARNARTADGSVLEFGLKYHLEHMEPALEKGIPNDPRFPERDNEWIAAREKEYNLLVEWLEDFTSRFVGHEESKETILTCQAALASYVKIVTPLKVINSIQNAILARREQGSVLEFGLKYHLDGLNKALEKGIPNNPRFPERDNEWIAVREKEYNLLVEWFEDFKTKFQDYDQSIELLASTNADVYSTLFQYREKVVIIKAKLEIQNARNAKKSEGSILEYGYGYHSSRLNDQINKGIPENKSEWNSWVSDRTAERNILLEWFEDFKSKFIDSEYAQETIAECEGILNRSEEVIQKIQIPLLVENAIKEKGSRPKLEFGYKYHADLFKKELSKGISGDPRHLERDNKWVSDLENSRNLLLEWYENFRLSCGSYAEAESTINDCIALLEEGKQAIDKVKIPLQIKNARAQRGLLEFGLDYHINGIKTSLEKGFPEDERFPERSQKWIDDLSRDYKLLLEWLENFKTIFSEYELAQETIKEAYDILTQSAAILEKYRVPLLIKNAVRARKENGSVLEFGLDYHLKRMNDSLDKGLPGDERFPERDQEWLENRIKERSLLVTWLEEFKANYIQYSESTSVISEVDAVLNKCREKIDLVKRPLEIKAHVLAKKANGSVLEFGLTYHLNRMKTALSEGLKSDERFPERDKIWVTNLQQDLNLLIEWQENFRNLFGDYSESTEIINENDSIIKNATDYLQKISIPLLVKSAINAKRADGSVLEFGIRYHLEQMNQSLDKGLPGDERFPERDTAWIVKLSNEYSLLIQWTEDFNSKYGLYDESAPILQEINSTIEKYNDKVNKVKIPLLIQNAILERTILEFGLKYHLNSIRNLVASGPPCDNRFPERDREWIDSLTKQRNSLLEWLSDFQVKYEQYSESKETIDECSNLLKEVQLSLDKFRIPFEIKTFRGKNKELGLEYGLDYHLSVMVPYLDKFPNQPSFPERDIEWMKARELERNQLISFLENFKTKFEGCPESIPTIEECEQALLKYDSIVPALRIPLEIKNARRAKRNAENPDAVLEYGLDYHLENMKKALESGLPSDPRFPEFDNKWIEQREVENAKLIEWLELFKSKYGDLKESQTTILDCIALLDLYKKKVEPCRIPLLIQNKRKEKGNILEYGFEYHINHFNTSIEKGPPNDERFPERDFEWIDSKTKDVNLLINWLEQFSASCGEYSESQITIKECNDAISAYKKLYATIKVPMDIKKHKNTKKIYLSTILDFVTKGPGNDPRFPERDFQWIEDCKAKKMQVVEWLEDFRSLFGEYELSFETIDECQNVLTKCDAQLTKFEVPLKIKKYCGKNQLLEYGLDYSLNSISTYLQKGLPQSDNQNIFYVQQVKEFFASLTKEVNKVEQWIEEFKSLFNSFPESFEIVQKCETLIYQSKHKFLSAKTDFEIVEYRVLKKDQGSVLEYGYDYHVGNMKKQLETGPPRDPRFPERDHEWVSARVSEKKLLDEWYSQFIEKFTGSESTEFDKIKNEYDSIEKTYKTIVNALRIPLEVQKLRNNKKANGSVLEFGLDYHLNRMNQAITQGPPNDTRFPGRNRDWVNVNIIDLNLLVEWLEIFRSSFDDQSHEKVSSTIDECQTVISKSKSQLDSIRIPLAIQEARNEKGLLPYGLEYHLNKMKTKIALLSEGNSLEYQEKVKQWEELQKDNGLLVEWHSQFTMNFVGTELAVPTTNECDLIFNSFNSLKNKIQKPLDIERAKEIRQKDGSILEYGYQFEVTRLERELNEIVSLAPSDSKFDLALSSLTSHKDRLEEWLNFFIVEFGENDLTKNDISKCKNLFTIYSQKVSKLRVPVEVEKSKMRNGLGKLEYGLAYHLTKMNSLLKDYSPNERFVEKDFGFISELTKYQSELLEFIELFKSKFVDNLDHQLVSQTIKESEEVLKNSTQFLVKNRIPTIIKKAKLDRTILPYGFDHQITSMKKSLELYGTNSLNTTSCQFKKWIDERNHEYNRLIEWLNDLRLTIGDDTVIQDIIKSVDEIETLYKKTALKEKKKNQLISFCNEKSENQVLDYSLSYHLEKITKSIQHFIDNSSVLPRAYLSSLRNEKRIIDEWYCLFKSNFEGNLDNNDELITIYKTNCTACETVFKLFKEKIESILLGYEISQSILETKRTNENCALEYGVNYHLEKMNNSLQSSPKDIESHPDRNTQWMNEREKEKLLLIEWVEDFKSKYFDYLTTNDDAKKIIARINESIALYNKVVGSKKITFDIIEWKTKGAGILPYGLDYHLSQLNRNINDESADFEVSSNQKKLLIEFNEAFKAQFIDFIDNQAVSAILKLIESTLAKFQEKFSQKSSFILKREVGLFCSSKTILEYGFDYHMKKLENALNVEPIYLINTKEVDTLIFQLIEWKDLFKLKFESCLTNELITPILNRSNNVLKIYNSKINGVKQKEVLKKLLEERTQEFPYGINYSLDQYNLALQKLSRNSSPNCVKSILITQVSINTITSYFINWIELNKSKIISTDNEETIITRIEASLKELKEKCPSIYALALQEKVGTDTENDDRDESDSGVSQPQARDQKGAAAKPKPKQTGKDVSPPVLIIDPAEVYDFKELFSSDAKDNEESELVVEKEVEKLNFYTVTATEDDRKFSESEAYYKSIQIELEKKEKSLSDSLGRLVVVAIDWDFIQLSSFTSKSEDDRKKIAMSLAYGLISKLILSDDGLVGLCNDKTGKELVQQKVAKIIITYDGLNTQPAPGISFTLKQLENLANKDFYTPYVLYVKVNIDSWQTSFQGKDIKLMLQNVFDFATHSTFAACSMQIKAMTGTVQSNLNKKNKILLRLNYDNFINHPKFLEEKKEVQLDIIKALVKQFNRFLVNSGGKNDSFIEVAVADVVTKAAVIQQVSVIEVTFDPTSSINNNIGSKKEFELKLTNSTLFVSINMNKWKEQYVIEGVSEKMDSCLGIIVKKAIHLARTKLLGYASIIQKKTGLNMTVEVEWSRWALHNNFTSQSVAAQSELNDTLVNKRLNDLINSDGGLCELFTRADGTMRNTMKSRIKRIVLGLNPLSNIDDGAGEQIQNKDIVSYNEKFYRISFYPGNGVLLVEANMNAVKIQWVNFEIKLIPLLQSLALRGDLEQKTLTLSTEIADLLHNDDSERKKYIVAVDFKSFINKWNFLGLQPNNMDITMKHLHMKHVLHLKKILTKVASHPLGKQAIRDQISKFLFTINPQKKAEKVTVAFDGPERTLTISINYEEITGITFQNNWRGYQLRHLTNSLIPISRDRGLRAIEGRIKELHKQCPEINLEYDWSYVEHQTFLSLHPQKIQNTLKRATGKLVAGVLINGLVAVCTHPIGKQNVNERIKKVIVRFISYLSEESKSNSKHSAKDSKVIVDGEKLIVICNIDTLDNAINSRYKERIEFEYDLIVAIAKDNAMKGYNNALKTIQSKTNNSFPVNISHANFTLLSSFRDDLSPPQQADIITAIYSLIPNAIFPQFIEGLNHDIVKTRFNEKIKKIDFIIDPTNSAIGFITTNSSIQSKYRNEPSMEIVNDALVITINLDQVLYITELKDWKIRLIDLLDLVVKVIEIETKKGHDSLLSTVDTYFKKGVKAANCPITINWDFTKTPSFLQYFPTERWEFVSTANELMINTSLIGQEAFADTLGLAEFPLVIDEIQKSIENISFAIDDKASYLKIVEKVLIISYPLINLINKNFRPCYKSLEDLLTLTTLIKKCAVERGIATVAKEVEALFRETVKLPITCNWDDWVPNLKGKYIEVINNASHLPGCALLGGYNDWGNIGLNTMLSKNQALKTNFNNTMRAIRFVFDASNGTSKHIGKSRGLNARCYVLSVQNNELIIKMNLGLEAGDIYSVGRVVHFLLQEGDALAEESREISRRANIMREQEQQRRDDAVRWAKSDNKDIENQNKSDQDRYKQDMERWKKEMDEKCNYSQCNKGYSKCGVCQSRGWNENNGNKSTCTSCKGEGKFPCNNCNGTMKQHPNGVTQPQIPSPRPFKDIPTFGSMPRYEDQI